MANPGQSWRLGNRIAPPRFIVFAGVMIAGTGLAMVPFGLDWARALMAGFDAAAIVFLVSLWPVFDDESDTMRARSRANDANRAGLLLLTALVSGVILVAVASELSGEGRPIVALVIATLLLAWLFSNIVYALHYADLFYTADAAGKDDGGLEFPDCDEPDYSDFTYFSFTLGMTFQTSDVSIVSRRVRRVATGQCLAAFVFNIGVIAFTINVLGN